MLMKKSSTNGVFFMSLRSGKTLKNIFLTLTAAMIFFAAASPARAQKNKKTKPETPADSTNPLIPMPDEQQIDYMISEMLGAWQIGDTEKMHKDYADDVVVVSGVWEPPVIGWANYLKLYQLQKARMQQVRMDRSNTVTKVAGQFAWAAYQWDFAAVVDGQQMGAQGHTTLILEKRNNHWVIVHNHTSILRQEGGNEAPTNAPPVSQPPPAAKP
jgi:ketosteroid isomerase-like protein